VNERPSREFELQLDGNTTLANLCGPLDSNLQLLEERLGVRIRRRGQHFSVHGERAGLAEAVLRDLAQQAAAQEVTSESVHLGLVEHGNAAADKSGRKPGHSGDVVIIRTPAVAIRARRAPARLPCGHPYA
jgi:phosphate starvation-inducible PhoH-like protein